MESCISTRLWACKCRVNPSIQHFTVSKVAFYPKSNLLMMDSGIFLLIFPAKGQHYINAVMCAIAANSIQRSVAFTLSGRVCRNIVTTVPSQSGFEVVWWTLLRCTVKVTSIQAWFRRILAYRRFCKRLALAMALHPRLGENSPLNVLCDDHVESFVEY